MEGDGEISPALKAMAEQHRLHITGGYFTYVTSVDEFAGSPPAG